MIRNLHIPIPIKPCFMLFAIIPVSVLANDTANIEYEFGDCYKFYAKDL